MPTLDETMAGQRLDKALVPLFPDLSRARLQALIGEGCLTLNGHVETDPARKLKGGEIAELVLPQPEPSCLEPQAIALDIAYEDADLVVINKPAGMVVHPSSLRERNTLVHALLHHCGDSLSGMNGELRPGIVHRLDKDTSGLIVVAKHDRAHRKLADQFADHGRTGPLEREYEALVWGVMPRHSGTVEGAIARSNSNREKMVVSSSEQARFAITHYEVLATCSAGEADRGRADGRTSSYPTKNSAFLTPHLGVGGASASQTGVVSHIACRLETGRTHQIRVHMAHIGHPLLGDSLYGSGFRTREKFLSPGGQTALAALGRQALHARLLAFAHPRTGEVMRFEAEAPADFATLLAALQT